MRRPDRAQVTDLLMRSLDKALAVQTPAVHAYVDRAREGDLVEDKQRLVTKLERQYLAAVTTMGGATGAAAAAPGAGTAVALPINLAEIGGFLELSTLFILAVAEVHGVHPDDLERRRTLVLAVLLGQKGVRTVQAMAGRTGPHWARQIVRAIPMQNINAINRVLGKNFVTKYGTKQGILVLGRELPLGIGAAIGAGGNLGFGSVTVRAARRAFGTPAESTSDPRVIDLDPVEPDVGTDGGF